MRTIQREIASAFIFSKDGYILLGKNAVGGVYQNKWLIPGGGVDDSESLYDALKREVREEVGFDVDEASVEPFPNVISGKSERKAEGSDEVIMVEMNFNDFIVRFPKPASELVPALNDDFAYAEWVPEHDLGDREFSPGTHQRLQELGLIA